MSQNTVSVVGPRAEQRQEKQPKKDPLDTILQGLQLAQGITGIAVNYQNFNRLRGENAQVEDANAGIQPVKERQRAVEQGLQPVEVGTPGSQTFKYRQGEGEGGVVEQAFILPKKEAAEKTTGAVKEVMGPNGSPILQYVTGKEEKPYTPYIKPEKPAKDITVSERNTLQNQYDRDLSVRKNRAVFQSLNEAETYANEKTPASDMSLVIAYYKANDPTSIVKESEAETAQALGGLTERAKAWYSKNAGDGDLLTDKQRADLLRAIRLKAKAAAKDQDGINNDFVGLAGNRGVETKDLRFVKAPTFDDKPEDNKKTVSGKNLAPTKSGYLPGTIVQIGGKQYQVGNDGDELHEMTAVGGN